MNIVHINNIDLAGSRFNGHDMQIYLNKRGISCKQFVMDMQGNDPNTIPLARSFEEPFLRSSCMNVEADLSIHSMIYPYGWRLLKHDEFKKADVVHYHLLHNFFVSYAMFPNLVAAKPSVLTIHDPWLFTGHCVYPIDCNKWDTSECENCPHLDRYFPMKEDKASYMWKLKKDIFSNIDIDLVVASKWMLNLAQRSPITAHIKNIHHIPFGIDTDIFSTKHDKAAIRDKLGIPQDHVVLFFRSDSSPFKGLSYIQEMLKRLNVPEPLTLLTVDKVGLVKKGRHELLEKGWVSDDAQLSELYAAADIFLMPSIAEAFGLMAIEAMASGIPVVVFDGTSLPDVTFSPECGIAIKNNDVEQFAKVIERLINNPDERQIRGDFGRELALKHYKVETHFSQLLSLYGEILQR